jgi:hypothetical protein
VEYPIHDISQGDANSGSMRPSNHSRISGPITSVKIAKDGYAATLLTVLIGKKYFSIKTLKMIVTGAQAARIAPRA